MTASKLAILAWSVGESEADLCAAPFVYALAAAALDCEVEIHLAGSAVRLLRREVAQAAITTGGRSVLHFMEEAANAGVRFVACAMAKRQHLGDPTDCLDVPAEEAGATAFVVRALDPEWRTLVF